MIAISFLEDDGKILDDTYLLRPDSIPFLWLLLAAVVVAPIIEEVSFRLWLTPKYFWAFCLMVPWFMVSYPNTILIIVLAILTLLIFIFYKKVRLLSAHNIMFILIFSSVLFAIIHGSNFTEIHAEHFLLLPYYTGVGAILGLLRLKWGLWASMLLHFAFNLLAMATISPPLMESKYELGSATLIEHQIFHKQDINVDLNNYLFNTKVRNGIVHSLASRLHPGALVIVEAENETPFHKYSLIADGATEEIFDGIMDHFSYESICGLEESDIIRIELFEQDDYSYSTENMLKHRYRGIKDMVFPSGTRLAYYFEKEYEVKVVCDLNCTVPIVLPVSNQFTVYENLDQLKERGVLDYKVQKSEIEVIRIVAKDGK